MTQPDAGGGLRQRARQKWTRTQGKVLVVVVVVVVGNLWWYSTGTLCNNDVGDCCAGTRELKRASFSRYSCSYSSYSSASLVMGLNGPNGWSASGWPPPSKLRIYRQSGSRVKVKVEVEQQLCLASHASAVGRAGGSDAVVRRASDGRGAGGASLCLGPSSPSSSATVREGGWAGLTRSCIHTIPLSTSRTT